MKNIKFIKTVFILVLITVFSFSNFAAIVSDNDGTAFVNKQDFEDLKKNFESQIENYSDSIDRKIDGAIASYLNGVKVAAKTELTSLLNKVNDDCNDSHMVGGVETKYNYRCMAKSYTAPTTQKPEGAIVNFFLANSKILNTNPSSEPNNDWRSMWHRVAMDVDSRTGLFDVSVPTSNRKTGKYIMLDVYKGKDEDKYYATNRYNDFIYRYYATGSGVASWGEGWPGFDNTNWGVTWSFPSFSITETEYWKMEIDEAVAYWNALGGATGYDNFKIFYGPTYETTESINVIPVVGKVTNTVYGLDINKITKMRLQDTTYNWTGYGDSVVTRGDASVTPHKSLWRREATAPPVSFSFNCHPYDNDVKLKDLIDYNATVAYADEEKKTVAIYGGLPVFRTPANGEVTMKIVFKSAENHDVYVGLQKKQFDNDETYVIDSDLNLRNDKDVKYTSNKFQRDKEYTFKMDVMKDDVIWIKTYDASSTTGFTGAVTNSIMLVEE